MSKISDMMFKNEIIDCKTDLKTDWSMWIHFDSEHLTFMQRQYY